MEFGGVIRQRRKEAGLTQEQLAKRIGCATITIRQYESGKRTPSLNVLQDIANALDLEIFDLLPDDTSQNAPFKGLSEEEKNTVLAVSGGNDTLNAILTIFFQLPDEGKIVFLKELKRLRKEAEEESNAVNTQEDN